MPQMVDDMAALKPVVTLPPPAAAHDDALAARRHWSSYEWSRGGDEWSAGFGTTDVLWTGAVYPRLASMLPARHIVEIGAGHGRMSRYLRGFAHKLTLVDVTPRCATACKERFAGDDGVRVVLNDGRSLADATSEKGGFGPADLVVSWSAMISVERSTLAAYLVELRQALRPGGVAFIHHSNAGSTTANIGGLGDELLGGRRKSQSAEGFREDCLMAGLRCLSQELVPMNGAGRYIDCFSLVMRDEANIGTEAKVVTADYWLDEVARCARIAAIYRKPA